MFRFICKLIGHRYRTSLWEHCRHPYINNGPRWRRETKCTRCGAVLSRQVSNSRRKPLEVTSR